MLLNGDGEQVISESANGGELVWAFTEGLHLDAEQLLVVSIATGPDHRLAHAGPRGGSAGSIKLCSGKSKIV
jgi:hypothetical protein